jgi:hypothetical protein
MRSALVVEGHQFGRRDRMAFPHEQFREGHGLLARRNVPEFKPLIDARARQLQGGRELCDATEHGNRFLHRVPRNDPPTKHEALLAEE